MRPFSFFTAITERANHKKFFEMRSNTFKKFLGLDLSAKRCRF